jgi:3-hydroxyisobutyrate dehydrogenase-like beta-hydroxyacid dehydrogenase
VPMPATALAQQMLQAAIGKGWGEDDFISVIRILEDWAGVEVRKS